MGLSDYEIKETLAMSSRSLIRRATRRSDGTSVILKSPAAEYPSAQELRQYEFEYRVLRRLASPGVVQAYALEMGGNQVALALEDFEGENLASGSQGLGMDEFFEVAVGVAGILGEIHHQGVVHKDVKPRNLLLNRRTRQLKLIDFHVASELLHERREAEAPNQLQGSLPYMSPEQTGRMNRELDFRSDYYSFGVTLYELLTGNLPFHAADAMGWIHAHLSRRAPYVHRVRSDVPEMVAKIVDKLLAKDPDERYQSARGLVFDLEECRSQWEGTGRVETFPLGTHDVSEQFSLPQKTFGRGQELGCLLEALEQAIQGRTQLVLLSGPLGVGKSALVDELRKSVIRRGGCYAAGRSERLERHIPYEVFAQALRGVIQQVLSQPEERLRAWTERCLAALGGQGEVMLDLVPELAQVIGPQPALARVAPAESQRRFRRVFGDFLRALAAPTHPLVLFLDDLQWVDATTPELIGELLAHDGLGHILLIGAYRDSELVEGDALTLCMTTLRSTRANSVHEIVLDSLDESAINQMVAEALHAPERDTRDLTAVIYQKTAGNPLFTGELLMSLHRAGAFELDRNSGRWCCDLERVREAGISDNLAELVVDRLKRLPAAALDSLKTAAVIGERFDVEALAAISGQTSGQIARTLWEPIQQGIIVPLDGNYRLLYSEQRDSKAPDLNARCQFQHERLQQVAYALLGESERIELHHKTGQRLLANQGAWEDRLRLFEMVNHLNLAQSLLASHEQRRLLAQLNFQAGIRAKQSATYPVAARYLAQCEDLLAAAGEELEAELGFDLVHEQAECSLLAGDAERAEALCERAFALAQSRLAEGSIYYLKTRVVEHRGRLQEAIATARAGLRLFGVELPDESGAIEAGIAQGIARMQAHLGRVPIESLAELPEMSEPEQVMTMNLLFQVVPAAIQLRPPLFILAELLLFDLAMTHGVTVVSCKNFIDCGIIQGGMLGDYDAAYRLGKVAFQLLDRYRPTPLESSVHFVFGTFIAHWRSHFDEGFAAHAKAIRLGLELGDMEHVAYATVFRIKRMVLVGKRLEECAAENADAVAYLARVGARGQLAGALVAQRAVARLTGAESDPDAAKRADEEAAEEVKRSTSNQWVYAFGQVQMMVNYLLGDLEAARRWQRDIAHLVRGINGLFSLADYHLFSSLLLIHAWPEASETERNASWERLTDAQNRLRKWAECCPENFGHKFYLLSAEMARLKAEPMDQIVALYDQAITATGGGFLHLGALAHERQADFWFERGNAKIAKMLLREAYHLYAQWGARAKLAVLEEQHPGWFVAPESTAGTATHSLGRSTTATGAVFDLNAVLDATQAISSEVKTERLFATLMNTILENAGAQRASLVVRSDSDQRLYVETSASIDRGTGEVAQGLPLESAGDVCVDLVQYVSRTRETVVLDDACHQGGFQSDPYLQLGRVKSVLCMPVLHQNSLVAILYAENNAASCAFTKQRLGILQVIASQAAISISNALLYDQLERKVERRTAEVAQKNREIEAMLHAMDQGVFAIDEELTIQPQYSRHLERLLGTREIVGQPCLPLLFGGAELGKDSINAMEAALRFSFGAPAILAETNMGHLVREFSAADQDGAARHFELDWNLILDAHGRVAKILVALRDVTLLRQLQATAAQKSRETAMVGQILDCGLERFRDFCDSARHKLRENRSLLLSSMEPSRAFVQGLFRNVHALKGTARLLGLHQLVEELHAAEEDYAALREADEILVDGPRLIANLDQVSCVLDEYEATCATKLAPLWQGQDVRLDQAVRAIESALEAATGNGSPASALPCIEDTLKRLRAVPLRQLVKDTSRALPSLAQELQKSVPAVECHDQGAVIASDWVKTIEDVLVQSFRNSLAHGVEYPAERIRMNKAPSGVLSVAAEQHEEGMRVSVWDDGRGLPVEDLRRRMGLDNAPDDQVAEALFSAGISTSSAVSRVSGRGVGMDLVRSAVRRLGGDVEIRFTEEYRDGHRPFALVVSLPKSAVWA